MYVYCLRAEEVVWLSVRREKYNVPDRAAQLIEEYDLVDAVFYGFDVGKRYTTLELSAARVGYAQRVDPHLAEPRNFVAVAVNEVCVDFAVYRVLHFEVVGLGVRRNEAVKVASGDAAIHDIETVVNAECRAPVEEVLHRARPGLVLASIIRSIEVG